MPAACRTNALCLDVVGVQGAQSWAAPRLGVANQAREKAAKSHGHLIVARESAVGCDTQLLLFHLAARVRHQAVMDSCAERSTAESTAHHELLLGVIDAVEDLLVAFEEILNGRAACHLRRNDTPRKKARADLWDRLGHAADGHVGAKAEAHGLLCDACLWLDAVLVGAEESAADLPVGLAEASHLRGRASRRARHLVERIFAHGA